MALIHAREHDKSPVSEEPSESLKPGDIVVREEGGGARLVDPEDDDEADGIVLHYELGDNIADHERDFRDSIDDFTYDPAEDDDYEDYLNLAPIQLFEDQGVVRPYTIDDEDQPAPSIERGTTVGVAEIDGEVQVVEDGYEDSDENVYGTGDEDEPFVELGSAEVDAGYELDEYDTLVPVRV